jgi:hypothetical protein
MTLKRVVLVAILAGVALLPATAASAGHRPARIRLSLVPLQTAQLGSEGASFALNYDSGSISRDGYMVVTVDSEGGVDQSYEGVVTGTYGLIGGHVLDYGDPYTGSAGVTDIRSSVAEYKTRADAKSGLSAARQEDAYLKDEYSSPYLAVTEKTIKPSPVGQPYAIYLFQGYTAAPPALSDYEMTLQPAGTYGYLDQEIGWWPTATEATYAEIYGAAADGGFGISIGFAGHPDRRGGVTVTPVDLSSIDDPATGYLVTEPGESDALVTVTNGQAGESIVGASHSTLQASDVLSLAQAAANRLDAGLGP